MLTALQMGGCAQDNYYQTANAYGYDDAPVGMPAPPRTYGSSPAEEERAVEGPVTRDPGRRSMEWTTDDDLDGQTYVYRGGRDPVTGKARTSL